MSIEIKVPALRESVIEATIARGLKNEGDAVKRDEPLVELETDKVHVPSPAAGVLERIEVKADDTVNVGSVLGAVKEGPAAPAPAPAPAPAESKFGSLMSTPILNMPQSGILGMHKIQISRAVLRPSPRGRARSGDLSRARERKHRRSTALAAGRVNGRPAGLPDRQGFHHEQNV